MTPTTAVPPPSQVGRHQDASQRGTGVDVCPAGWSGPGGTGCRCR
ncbi:hypothetical protein [Nonomuraea sp. NPDC049400]